MELVQPLTNDNIFSELLHEHGEGIHFVQFPVDDIQQTNRIMKGMGIPVLMGGSISQSSFAYYDTQDKLKIIWQAFQSPK